MGARQASRPRIRLVHAALEEGAGARLADARLSDRQRVALLLQLAALLSQLEAAGWRLVGGLERARVDDRGLLRGLATAPGRGSEPAQAVLAELALRLFRGEREIAGRGHARGIARRLLERWRPILAPLPADGEVALLLERASFLWDDAFAAARSSLAGLIRGERGSRLWVAGPGHFRAAMLAGAGSLEELERRLASPAARSHWLVETAEHPSVLAERGRWRAAVAAWRARPPAAAAERLEMARALYALARFDEARRTLHHLRSAAARTLRAWCLCRLGRLRGARRELAFLEDAALDFEQLFSAASVAARVFGNLEAGEAASRWVERLSRAARRDRERLAAHLVAAVAAWDRGDEPAMEEHLERSAGATAVAGLAWRWHRARGLAAMARGNGHAVVSHLSAALGSERRRLLPFEAAGLWNELAIGRALAGDLAGAERALGHALRLHRDAEGPRTVTLMLSNLAEIRLRRGRLDGIEQILRSVEAKNRRARNRRGIVHDAELRARFELARGRPGAALEEVQRAQASSRERSSGWRLGVLHLLAARALGWLDRPREALAELGCAAASDFQELEPEERPAIWALAGDREMALRSVADGPGGQLWRALLTAGAVSDREWRATESLGEFRAARLVLDLELAAAGFAPAERRRRAAATFEGLGAAALAERLRGGDAPRWRSLRRFFEAGAADAAELLAGCGYPEARVTIADGGEESVLVDGPGGQHEVEAEVGAGRLVVRAAKEDAALAALAACIAATPAAAPGRPPAADRTARRRRPKVPGIVGSAPALTAALARLERLAAAELPLLLLGESGTGKELAARHAHRASPRADEAFLPINCAAVSRELLFSDLFGHVRGAFTGADRDRVGVFEAARGGTVFLDEIGDLPLEAQGLLLRLLQEGEVRRLGESLARRVDARVIAATHRDLDEMVAAGSFRRDLLFRLRVATVELPPLRQRGDDVLALARHFLARYSPHAVPRLSERARAALVAHDWPGNVRELENVVRVALAVADDGTITPEELDLPYRAGASNLGYHERVLQYRRSLLQEALTASGGNQAAAARSLGLSRQALSYLVKKLDLAV